MHTVLHKWDHTTCALTNQLCFSFNVNDQELQKSSFKNFFFKSSFSRERNIFWCLLEMLVCISSPKWSVSINHERMGREECLGWGPPKHHLKSGHMRGRRKRSNQKSSRKNRQLWCQESTRNSIIKGRERDSACDAPEDKKCKNWEDPSGSAT